MTSQHPTAAGPGTTRATTTGSGPALGLAPGARLLWRSAHSVQLELGEVRVRLEADDATALRELVQDLVARGRAPAAVRGRARARVEAAPSRVAAAAALHQLAASGLVWSVGPDRPGGGDAAAPGGDPRRRPPRPTLAGELAALGLRHGGGAAQVLRARGACRVVVTGQGRVGPALVAVLGAAGVGHVSLREPGTAGLRHVLPGGAEPADEGRPLAEVAEALVARVAPGADARPPDWGVLPDLLVLATDEPVDDERRAALHASRTAHLVVSLAAGAAVVGPLVLPGLTACLRCADLHRLDRDPAWSVLAAQLGRPTRAGGSAAALATTAVGVAATQALQFLDGATPAVLDGTLELHPPDWRVRRRSWPAHPDCDCSG